MKKFLKYCAFAFLIIWALILIFWFLNLSLFGNPTFKGINTVFFFLFSLLPEEVARDLFFWGGSFLPNPITFGIALIWIVLSWFYIHKFIAYVLSKIGIQSRFISISILLVLIVIAGFILGNHNVNKCIASELKSNIEYELEYEKGIIFFDNVGGVDPSKSSPLIPYNPDLSSAGKIFFFIHKIPNVKNSFEIDPEARLKDDAFIKVTPGTEIKTICSINESYLGNFRASVVRIED